MGLLDKLLPQKPQEKTAEPAELIEVPKLENSNLVELIDRDSEIAYMHFSHLVGNNTQLTFNQAKTLCE